MKRARGCVELIGPTWWLRLPVRETDPVTGEVRVRRRRIRLGPKTELRTQAAARHRADLWIALEHPEQLEASPGTLACEYFEHFLALHVPLMRPTTQRRYRSTIRNQLQPALARRALHEITAMVLQKMIADLTPLLARSTIGHARRVALQILRQARADGFLAMTIEPRDIKLPKQRTADREQRSISDAEFVRILAASAMPWRLLWTIFGIVGLRAGEALGLRWHDVDLEHGVLLIRQNAVEGRIHPPKTKGSQTAIPIIAPLGDLLREWRAVAPRNPLDLVFATSKGTALSSDAIRRRRLQPLLARLGIPRAGCHAFRHGAATRLLEAGCSPDVVRRILRHRNLATTQSYLHVDQSMLASAVARAGEHCTRLCRTAQTDPTEPTAEDATA